MTKINIAKEAALSKNLEIVEELLEKDNLFKNLNKNELRKIFTQTLDEVSPEEIISLDNEDLRTRVDRIMAIELLSGMLDDLTPEEIEIFDAAVKGK
ncbi:hypothetical protein [Oscillatoria salina]|uniref:hypothetical protein n=1 Tax=Oscillatoria salina TaxID=331517 RepID=UPI001CC9F542|nr:hypothetical protein [Oscillatoria salina]MBZ8180000.1 hypothetical protein [Oscillatoria salina IIICB1]